MVPGMKLGKSLDTVQRGQAMKTMQQRSGIWLTFCLLTALACVSHPTRISAEELRYQGRTFSEWQSDLKDLAPNVRIEAIEALSYFGSRAAPVITSCLLDSNGAVENAAANALTKLGSEAVPALIRALADGNPLMRWDAAAVLFRLGPVAKDAVPVLIRVFKDADAMLIAGENKGHKVRESVALALGVMGSDAKDAVPGLVGGLEDSDPWVRASSALALGQIGGPAAKETLPVLMRLFVREGYNISDTGVQGHLGDLLLHAIRDLSVACPDARLVILAPGKIEKVEIMARFGCWSGDVVVRSYPWRVDPSVDVWIQFSNPAAGTRFILYDSERKTGSDEVAQWSGSKMRMWFMAVKKDAEGVVRIQLK